MKSEQEWEIELQDILEKLRNNSISEVDLIKCYLDPNGAKVLAKALKVNHSLTTMDLSGNDIGAEGAKALAEVLKGNHSITTMVLSANKIGVEGAAALAEVLKENHSLAVMDLSQNNISAEGAATLAEALKDNHSLIIIALSRNDIGAEGAIALAEALKVNRSLTGIGLSRNNVSAEGAAALAEALKINRSLTDMKLGENNIGAKGAAALAEVLKVNHSLRKMYLGSNNIGADGTIVLAEALKENHSLTGMGLGKNDIGAEGAIALAEALTVNRSLTDMNLYDNYVGAKGTGALTKALEVNRSLTRSMFLDWSFVNAEQENIIKGIIKQNKYLERNIALRDQLHQAVQASDLKKAQEYIQRGAGLLSVTGEEENTPLHWAAINGHIDIVKLLLAKIAEQKLNRDFKNKDGKTPLDLAVEHEHKEVVTLLEEAMPKQKTIFDREKNVIEQEKVSVGNIQPPINVPTIQVINISKDILSGETERHIQRGEKFLAEEEYPKALQCFEEALKLQPEHAEALLRKGTALQKLTQLDEAKQIFEKIITIEDKNAEKYHRQAKKQLGKIEKKQILLQQQSIPIVVSEPIENTGREELLGRVSSKAESRKLNIQPNFATKIISSPAPPLSRNPARVQFNLETTSSQINTEIAEEKISTQALNGGNNL